MKLYDSRRAPNPRRVRWFMAEKGITDVEIVDVSIFEGQHKTPDYLAKAGLPHLPALEIDDTTTITESVAICRYLESVYPEPNMFGRDARETAIIEMWMRRVEMMVSTPLMMAVRHSHPAMAGIETQIPEVAQNNFAMAERALKVLDRRLGESPFIAADRVTMADILAITAIDFARMIRFRPPKELEHFAAWREVMIARPASEAGV